MLAAKFPAPFLRISVALLQALPWLGDLTHKHRNRTPPTPPTRSSTIILIGYFKLLITPQILTTHPNGPSLCHANELYSRAQSKHIRTNAAVGMQPIQHFRQRRTHYANRKIRTHARQRHANDLEFACRWRACMWTCLLFRRRYRWDIPENPASTFKPSA